MDEILEEAEVEEIEYEFEDDATGSEVEDEADAPDEVDDDLESPAEESDDEDEEDDPDADLVKDKPSDKPFMKQLRANTRELKQIKTELGADPEAVVSLRKALQSRDPESIVEAALKVSREGTNALAKGLIESRGYEFLGQMHGLSSDEVKARLELKVTNAPARWEGPLAEDKELLSEEAQAQIDAILKENAELKKADQRRTEESKKADAERAEQVQMARAAEFENTVYGVVDHYVKQFGLAEDDPNFVRFANDIWGVMQNRLKSDKSFESLAKRLQQSFIDEDAGEKGQFLADFRKEIKKIAKQEYGVRFGGRKPAVASKPPAVKTQPGSKKADEAPQERQAKKVTVKREADGYIPDEAARDAVIQAEIQKRIAAMKRR